jgi:DNA-binding HxlR family transcriptional regulator
MFMTLPEVAVSVNARATGHHDRGIHEALARVGDKYSVLVIVELSFGARRFGDLQRAIHGISKRMLTLTVRRLERDGLVKRTLVPTVPAHVSYTLTDAGSSLTRLVESVAEWSLEQRPAIAESRSRYDAANPGHFIGYPRTTRPSEGAAMEDVARGRLEEPRVPFESLIVHFTMR